MSASPWYSKDFVSLKRKDGGEFNMAESSICVGSVDCLSERALEEEARPN